MKKEFNQKKYIQDYKKENYKVFKAELKKEEFEELEKILKFNNLNKADFLRESIKKFKKEK